MRPNTKRATAKLSSSVSAAEPAATIGATRGAGRPTRRIRSGAAVDDQFMAQLDPILVQPTSVTPLNNEMEQDDYNLFK